MASQNTTSLTETFDLLTDPRRRYVLYYLTEESEVVDSETLAAAIREWERGPPVTGRKGDSDAVEMVLRHTHLPKLADAGLITFDAVTGAVELDETKGHDLFIAEAARIDGYTQTAASD